MKKYLPLIAVICLCLLGGCFPTGEVKISDNSKNTISLSASNSTKPDTIDMTLDNNLLVKADVSATANNKMKIASISLKKFDENKIKSIFLENKSIASTYEEKNDYFKDYTWKSFECADRSFLKIDLGDVWYGTRFYRDRDYTNVISGTEYFIKPDLKNVYKQDTLDGIDKNAAILKVKTLAQQLGITVADTPEVVALDAATLESNWRNYETKTGKPPKHWEKADEAYVITFPVMYDNTTITNKGYISAINGIPAIGSRIIGVVAKDGVISFRASGIYETGAVVKDNITPITIEAALTQIKNKYKDTMLTTPVVIKNIALEYVPTVLESGSAKFQLAPVWVFTAEQERSISKGSQTDKITTNFPIYILADTGKELRIGGKA